MQHPSSTIRIFRMALRAALAAALLGSAFAACGGEGGDGDDGGSGSGGAASSGAQGSTSSGPGECVGGVIVNGVCEGKCTPDKCLPDNVCVGNRCVLKCDSHLDCAPDNTQACTPATEDDTNAPVNVCLPSGKHPAIGMKCPFGNECDTFFTCPNGAACNPADCGGNPGACVVDDVACGGAPGCTIGKCPDGSACTVPACPPEQCRKLSCLTAGPGDADAYCTNHDCQADTDCPGGFYCGVTRDPHEICGSNPKKGNNNLCGKTPEPCLDPSAFQAAGATYFEGSLCLLRRTCVKREACAPCTSDVDCSHGPGMRCVDIGGSGHCAADCLSDADCDPDRACVSGSCVPRFGACKGTGNFCEPCLNDADCGPEASCIDASGNQKACMAIPVNIPCTTDADCPKSPSGKNGECLDEGENLTPQDPAYHYCYLPFNQAKNKFGCW